MLTFFKDLAAAIDELRRHAVLFLLIVALTALALLGRSWLDAHDARLHLEATLAAQQKTITTAEQSQATRDAQLTQSLAQIAVIKQKVQTPAQAAAALAQAFPQFLASTAGAPPLAPITIEVPPGQTTTQQLAQTNANAAGNQPATSVPSGSQISLPTAPTPALIRVPQNDLKPLFDAIEDCQTCTAKLSAAQGDLVDETSKFTAVSAERDAALKSAHGTFWSRARHSAKWFVIGAVAGAIAARYH